MPVSVCPASEVHAPVAAVWALLTAPIGYGRFWDLAVERVDPPGTAQPGQRIEGWTRAFGRQWRASGDIVDVDAAQHAIRFRMTLPLGVVSDNRITCAPLDDARCLVRFG